MGVIASLPAVPGDQTGNKQRERGGAMRECHFYLPHSLPSTTTTTPPTTTTTRFLQSEPPAMPKSNEEEAAPVPMSTLVDWVSDAAEQLETVKLSDHDEARPHADTTAGDTNPKEDPELWKPPSPTEECPVCLVPLPLKPDKAMYWACCGKRLCTACSEEHVRALRVTNRKREKKKQLPLKNTCAFCRIPLHKNNAELIGRVEERIKKKDTRAMVQLAWAYRKGNYGLQKNEVKAVELFDRAADLGSVEAIAIVGRGLAFGEHGFIKDEVTGRYCIEDAVVKGDIGSRYNLATLDVEERNYDHAIKHWHLAAAAGNKASMKKLWVCFNTKKLSKSDLEKALRAHKAATDKMNSEERERYDAQKEAKGGNDVLLNNIYASYYLGFINAKELNVALKAHRAGNLRAVEALLNKKVPADKVTQV